MRVNLGDDEQPEIGLIALIDCIFFLLMFFMVATSFKQTTEHKKIKELPLMLPSASASFDRAAAASSQPLIIGVDQVGDIYLDGAKTSTQTLHDRLRSEAEKNPNRSIRIDGDQSTSYKNIVHVLDLCQFEKLTNVALHTRN